MGKDKNLSGMLGHVICRPTTCSQLIHLTRTVYIYNAADSAACLGSPVDLTEAICSIWLNCDLLERPAQRINPLAPEFPFKF